MITALAVFEANHFAARAARRRAETDAALQALAPAPVTSDAEYDRCLWTRSLRPTAQDRLEAKRVRPLEPELDPDIACDTTRRPRIIGDIELRLTVLRILRESGELRAQDIAARLNRPGSQIGPTLAALQRAGLIIITREERSPRGHPRPYYAAAKHPASSIQLPASGDQP